MNAVTAPKPSRPAALLVQISDLHLRPDAAGDGPAARLAHAIEFVRALDPPPDAVLVTGDVADTGAAEAYRLARSMLSLLGVPVHAIPGNHDDRDLLRAHFPSPGAEGSPVRFSAVAGALRIVACDSTVPGRDGGELDEENLEWLERTLAAEPAAPTLLALHHPPVMTGIRVMDAIALAEPSRRALERLLERHAQVVTVTCGHVHTAATTAFAGRPMLVCPSVNSTVRLDLRQRDDLRFAPSGQPVGLVVHALIDGRLISHHQPLALALPEL